METNNRQKCTRCKMNLTLDNFKKKRDDTYQKTCEECLVKKKANTEKNKCEHGRQRNKCKECGGNQICEHGKQKAQCKDCGGISICEHGRQRCRCKECGGISICEHGRIRITCKDCEGSQICEHGRIRNMCKDCGGNQICEHGRQRSQCKDCSDPVKITIKNMIKHSKETDKKRGHYDPVNFVDYCFVENLLDDYTHCYYKDCECELQLIKYQDNLATIERLDNDIGHIKSNCVICCLKCNCMKKSNK